jgi:50S ribosomal subunit-associated GTPase HflX
VRQLKTESVLDVCPISALDSTGVDRLLEVIGAVLDRQKEEFYACFSPAQGELVALLRERGRIVKEIYDGDFVRVTARVTPKLAGQVRKLLRTGTVHGERMS